MKYKDLLQGQSEESSIVCLSLLQSSDEKYEKLMKIMTERFNEEVPEYILQRIRKK